MKFKELNEHERLKIKGGITCMSGAYVNHALKKIIKFVKGHK